MEDQQPIEELFRESLQHHEEPVNPELWDRISRQLNAPITETLPKTDPASTAVTPSGWLGGTTLQWIAAAVITLSAGTGAYLFLSDSTGNSQQNEKPILSEKIGSEITPETFSPSSEATTSDENNRNVAVNLTGEEQGTVEESDSKLQEVITNSPAGNNSNDVSSSEKASYPINESVSNSGQGKPSVETNHPSPVIESLTPPVLGQLTAIPTTGTAPLKVTFHYRGEADKLQWDFGDGQSLQLLHHADHTFNEPGEYTITLKGVNQQQKPIMETVSVKVLADLTITGLPNVLTPNYDGLNDVFSFNSSQFVEMEVNIYDQAGNMVHRFRDTGAGWDGKLSNGKEAGEGTYIYIIFAKSHDQRQHQQKGLLRLIR